MARTFVVATNPDPASQLPYLLRLPLPGGDLLLKARDAWPRTARVYCHPLDAWPENARIVEQVPVRACTRRGVAIDLVLDRPRENRSQFVFAKKRGGHDLILWQSARVVANARPGVRVPRKLASGQRDLVILVDTRERYAYRFSEQQATTERRALPSGDYGVEFDGEIVAVVERKSLGDLLSRLNDGKLAFDLAELATVARAAVVVDDRYSSVFKHAYGNPGFLADLLATLQVRYPAVPIVFCENRRLAEEWTYRYLAAARSWAEAERDADDWERDHR